MCTVTKQHYRSSCNIRSGLYSALMLQTQALMINKFTLSSSLSASQRYFSAWKRPHSYWMKCRIPGSVIPESPSCGSRCCDDPGMAPAAAAAAAAAAIAPVAAADDAWPGAALGPFGLRPAPLLLPPPPEFGFGPPPDLSASILTVQPFARIRRWKRAECTNNNNKKTLPRTLLPTQQHFTISYPPFFLFSHARSKITIQLVKYYTSAFNFSR